MKNNKLYILNINRSDIELDRIEFINSIEFKNFLKDFYKYNNINKIDQDIYKYNHNYKNTLKFLRLILIRDEKVYEYIYNLNIEKRLGLLNFIDDIFDYWRSKKRFLLLNNINEGEDPSKLIKLFNYINNFIESFYRFFYEAINMKHQINYRELPAGFNSGILLNNSNYNLPQDYSFLNKIKSVETIVTRPPFMINTLQNKRKGFFYSLNNKVKEFNINENDYLNVLIKINHKRGIINIHKDYLYYIPALANLFEFDSLNSFNNEISFIVFFGAKVENKEPYFYNDNNLYIGVCPYGEDIDYFGYLKKTILTLYNLINIDNKILPIHGAGVELTLSNNKKYNLCFLGDSGAGKSETLEAIKKLNDKRVLQVKTIFDDMGSFEIKNNEVIMNGSEIGAFVRYDDLDKGYPLKSVDRAIYLNIDTINSRTVIPIIDYLTTCKDFKVDYFFLTDNFTDSMDGILFYKDINLALNEFKKGERKAKGTTHETGIVSSYFANPFGPTQKQNEVELFIKDYFNKMNENKVKIGRLFSRLSIDPEQGPLLAAKKLIDVLLNEN